MEGYDTEVPPFAAGPAGGAVGHSVSRKSSKKSKKSKRSRESSRSSRKDFQPVEPQPESEPIAAAHYVDEPEALKSYDDPIVPISDTNPVTDEPEQLVSSYSATAAAALDKERKEDERKEENGKGHDAPIAFPKSPVDEAPVAFPGTADDASSIRTGPAGIKFSPAIQDTPRSETPDVEGGDDKEKKRKRISSQNFQRIARRISLVPKRSPSGSSATFFKDGSKDSSGSATPKKEGSSGSGFFSRLSREDSRASKDIDRSSINNDAAATAAPADEAGDTKAKGKESNRDKIRRRMSLKL